MTPLSRTATTEAETLIARAASVKPKPVDLAQWDEVVALAAVRPRRDWRLVPAFAVSLALGLGLVFLATPKREPLPAVQLVASSDAKWTQQSASLVVLTRGRMRVNEPSPVLVRLETPHVTLEAQRSRFLAEVIASGTSLVVEEGEVILRAGSVTRVVRAGESLVWPPAPTIPQALMENAPAPAEARCANAGSGRRDCLATEALGSSLEAQAALYELGALEASEGHVEAAISAWEQSLARFPDGVLHPEVRLKLLVELVRARRFSEAAKVADGFEQAASGDPRVEDVVSLRRRLPSN